MKCPTEDLKMLSILFQDPLNLDTYQLFGMKTYDKSRYSTIYEQCSVPDRGRGFFL
jgi:hypothetical protein